MKDNQLLFAAFLILIIASLNFNLSLTGEATREYLSSGLGTPTTKLLHRYALSYCPDKGDIDGNGIIDSDDMVAANNIYERYGHRGGSVRDYVYELDMFPVNPREGNCGDGYITYRDLLVMRDVIQDLKNEREDTPGGVSGRKAQTCHNECPYVGYISPSQFGGRVCGDYDGDVCLEWKEVKCPDDRMFVQTNNDDFLCVSGQAFEGFGVLEGSVRVKN